MCLSQPKINCGIKSDIWGTYVTTIKTRMLTNTKGQTPFMMLRTGLFKVDDATNMSRPKGGVIIPRLMLSVTIMPKWTGSTPMAVATGKRGDKNK